MVYLEVFKFLENYLLNRFQRVVLNGKESNWMNLKAGVPQGSVLVPMLFLIYINDLTDIISFGMHLFADDSSLITCDKGINQTHLNCLRTCRPWAYQWEIVFNPDLTKQAVEVVFSCKNIICLHPGLTFNGIPIARKPFTKHLGAYLDSR